MLCYLENIAFELVTAGVCSGLTWMSSVYVNTNKIMVKAFNIESQMIYFIFAVFFVRFGYSIAYLLSSIKLQTKPRPHLIYQNKLQSLESSGRNPSCPHITPISTRGRRWWQSGPSLNVGWNVWLQFPWYCSEHPWLQQDSCVCPMQKKKLRVTTWLCGPCWAWNPSRWWCLMSRFCLLPCIAANGCQLGWVPMPSSLHCCPLMGLVSSSVLLGKAASEAAFTSYQRKGKAAKMSVSSQEEMLKFWKCVCLENDTNTSSLRSGQLMGFDFDPLYFLFYMC